MLLWRHGHRSMCVSGDEGVCECVSVGDSLLPVLGSCVSAAAAAAAVGLLAPADREHVGKQQSGVPLASLQTPSPFSPASLSHSPPLPLPSHPPTSPSPSVSIRTVSIVGLCICVCVCLHGYSHDCWFICHVYSGPFFDIFNTTLPLKTAFH